MFPLHKFIHSHSTTEKCLNCTRKTNSGEKDYNSAYANSLISTLRINWKVLLLFHLMKIVFWLQYLQHVSYYYTHSQKNGVRFTRKLCQKVLSLSLYPNHSEVGCVLNWKSWTISYFMSSSFLFLSIHLHFFSAKWLCDLHNSWWCQIWPNLQ